MRREPASRPEPLSLVRRLCLLLSLRVPMGRLGIGANCEGLWWNDRRGSTHLLSWRDVGEFAGLRSPTGSYFI